MCEYPHSLLGKIFHSETKYEINAVTSFPLVSSNVMIWTTCCSSTTFISLWTVPLDSYPPHVVILYFNFYCRVAGLVGQEELKEDNID